MALTGDVKIGRLHKLYIEPSADLALPSWVEYGKIQGANKTGQKDRSEIKERDLAITTEISGHRKDEITLTLTKRPGNTEYDALEDAAQGDNIKIGIALMTGDIATPGERGFQAEMIVVGWDDDQAHDNSTVQVTLAPSANYVTAPAFVETV